ncbi:MAG: J domain-containing protein [Hyphomicrobiaceae bacterium]|nr:J domain-containing protein [Hyphomicrobiaceae bacterium]
MFERNRVDNVHCDRETGVPVEVTFDDGRTARGKFIVAATRPIHDALNGPGLFIDFEPYGGEREMVAKASLRAVRLVNVPNASSLSSRGRHDTFEPYEVLGLPHGSPWPAVREAYHRLSKLYHPDRYAAAELPDEVLTYMATMARRVNAAYAALAEPEQTRREVARNKSEPIYQSPPRA